MNSTGDQLDRRVRQLTKELSEAKDNNVPRLLLKIKEILTDLQMNEMQRCKQLIWKYNLLRMMLVSFKQDIAKLTDGWSVIAQLVTLFSQICSGLQLPDEDEQMFRQKFLPDAADVLLQVAIKMQQKYIKTSQILEDAKKIQLECFAKVLDGLTVLFSSYSFLVTFVLKSGWLMKLLMSEDVQTTILLMNLLQAAIRMQKNILNMIDEETCQHLLDELIFKLSSTKSVDLAKSSVRTLVFICESHPSVTEMLSKRYRGLYPLLNKWMEKGFNHDVRQLQLFMESGNVQLAKQKNRSRSAAVIQAFWRGYWTRKQLSKAKVGISKFQLKIRYRLEDKEKQKEDRRLQAELAHTLGKRRRRLMRQLYEKQLETLKLLPAAEVEKYLQNEQVQAAIKVQKVWRGFQTRCTLDSRRSLVTRTRAAIRIQRCVRKWLNRLREKRKLIPAWQRPPGLTDARRLELQSIIQERRENHTVVLGSKKEEQNKHDKAQQMIREYVISSSKTRRDEQKRLALLARIDTDIQLLDAAPKLCDLTEEELKLFVSHSVPVATKARHDHNEELRILRQPWWKKLGDEYQDEKLAEESEGWKLF